VQVRAGIFEVKSNLGALRLDVEPRGATIVVDGAPIGTAPLGGPHYLEPGEHRLAITADGYTPIEELVDLGPGKTRSRKVRLERVPVAANAAPPPFEVRRQTLGIPPPPRTGLYALVGVTSVLGIASATTGILALRKHQQFKDEDLGDTDRENARRAGRKLAIAADVLAIGTVAVGATCAYYYLRVYRPRRLAYEVAPARPADGEPSSVWIAPWGDGTSGGLAAGGAF
jgi:hypothetical protein